MHLSKQLSNSSPSLTFERPKFSSPVKKTQPTIDGKKQNDFGQHEDSMNCRVNLNKLMAWIGTSDTVDEFLETPSTL